MAKNIVTAKVAIVSIGSIEIEGLMLEDGRFAVSQQQAARLFSVIPTSATKWLNSLLEEGFQLFQVKTNRERQPGKQNRSENAISLKDFCRLTYKLVQRNNPVAVKLGEALFGLSLEQLFADAFDIELSRRDRQDILNRILDAPNPWERLYDPELCKQAFAWFGASFYWNYCYQWMTPEERCKVDRLNPVINGARSRKIHQYLEPETKKRLEPEIIKLGTLLATSDSKQRFLISYQRLHGNGKQLELFR